MQSGRGTSRPRAARKTYGCRQCAMAECCRCCNNWCHICGVAKCRAPRASRWAADTLNTQYTRDYPPKHVDLERRGPGKHLLADMPFYGQTTNRADYTPKAGRTQSARNADAPIPANRFDDTTTYKTHYPAKRADLEAPPQPAIPAWTAPFYGTSTYNTDYVRRRVRPWSAQPEKMAPTLPYEGTTEYQDQYPRKPMPPPELRASQALLPSSHVPTITTYGHDYVPKPFEKREKLGCCDDPRHPAHPVWLNPHGQDLSCGSACRRPPAKRVW